MKEKYLYLRKKLCLDTNRNAKKVCAFNIFLDRFMQNIMLLLVSKERTCLHFCIQSPSYSFIMEVDFYRKIQGRKVLFLGKFVQRHMDVSLNFKPLGDFWIYLNQFEVQCCSTEIEHQYISTIWIRWLWHNIP